jgi:hypothetical protein
MNDLLGAMAEPSIVQRLGELSSEIRNQQMGSGDPQSRRIC